MKVKAAVLFQLFEYRWSLLVYYCVILAVFAVNIISGAVVEMHDVSINGAEYSTAVFLFITGVLFMRIQFPFFLQNGISRRTTIVSSLLTAGIFAGGMSILTSLIALIASLLFPWMTTSFCVIYGVRFSYQLTVQCFFEGLLWSFTLNLLGYLMGLFLSSLLYRLNRLLKTIVWAGLGAFFLLILPGIDITITNGKIFKALGQAALFALGLANGNANPYFAVVTFLLIGALFVGGNFLFLRRATVKQ